ncbi:MAG: hypothetical protein ACREQ9_25420, partial [Candidatus Binatia bacterium]
FKHALTQEVAYESLLLERRSDLHERAARAIERLFAGRLEDHYEELAHHYGRSANRPKAIEYLRLVAQQAIQRSAHGEAIASLTHALELLEHLTDGAARQQQELLLRVTLVGPLTMTRGYAHPAVESACARALELCRRLGEAPALFPILLGMWRVYVVRAQYRRAHALAEQLLEVARSAEDPALLLGAHNALGVTLFYLGDLAPARAHFEKAIRLYDPKLHSPLLSPLFRTGQDPAVACRFHQAWTLWLLGDPEQARASIDAALELAQELSHPFTTAYAHLAVAILCQHLRESPAMLEHAEVAIAIANEHGYVLWTALGKCLKGWALTSWESRAETIEELREGLEIYTSTGAALGRSYYESLLADVYRASARAEDGLRVIEDALPATRTTGELFYTAEFHRLKGELLLHSPGGGRDAEASFLRAIAIAREQGARSLELRAATSLSRLLGEGGRKGEAVDILSRIYGWFTEGFDTADLREAKALLEELSA